MVKMKEQAEAAADKKQEALAQRELEVANLQRDIRRYKALSNQIRKTPTDQEWFEAFNYDQALTDITNASVAKETGQKEFEVKKEL